MTRTWCLALSLAPGPHGERWSFFSHESAGGETVASPFLSAARRFPTAADAYHFAHHRPELQSHVVLGDPRLTLPRFSGRVIVRVQEAAAA